MLTRSQSKSNKVFSFFQVPLLAALVAILGVAFLLYYFVVVIPTQNQGEALLKSGLDRQAALVVENVESWQDTVAALARDPEIAAALEAGNEAAITRFEDEISVRLPGNSGVRILDANALIVNTESTPPVTHVTLDLLRKTANGMVVSPEMILSRNSTGYLPLMAPVTGGEEIAGVLLVAFGPERLKQLLADIYKGTDGFVELRQNYDGGMHVIARQGDQQFLDGAPMAESGLAGAFWSLAYWPADPDAISNPRTGYWFWLGVLAILAALAAAVLLPVHSLKQALKADGGNLIKLLSDKRRNPASAEKLAFKLAFFQEMVATLVRTWRKQGDTGAPAGAENRENAAAEPDPNASQPRSDSLIAALRDDSDDLATTAQSEALDSNSVNPGIFRAYDIRGIVGETLTEEVVRQIGRAIGSEAYARGEQKIVVGRDGRLSGPSLVEALKTGLRESGRDVIDIGEVPTPLLYFATNYLASRSGVMLTGSHNPANYNGLKIVLAGETLSGDDIQGLYQRIQNSDFLHGKGSEEDARVSGDYINRVVGDVILSKPLKVAVDCGNGVAGGFAPQLYQAMGCEVVGLYTDVDGTFPNHHPDPSKPENLAELVELVKSEQADIGLAFDGDGDRLGVVTASGKIIWPDRQMMLYAMDVLSRNHGAEIIFDVKCSRHLADVITGHGGKAIMWKTGHSLIKSKMRETGALLAGECSGHIFFKERWFGFDDALYTGARLLEILANDGRGSDKMFDDLPDALATPELNVAVSDEQKFAFIKQLAAFGEFGDGKINTIDGVRVDYTDGWGLVRASNTTPCLVIRFEAENQAALERIQNIFREQLKKVDSNIELPF